MTPEPVKPGPPKQTPLEAFIDSLKPLTVRVVYVVKPKP
jgi:hypothetical protein